MPAAPPPAPNGAGASAKAEDHGSFGSPTGTTSFGPRAANSGKPTREDTTPGRLEKSKAPLPDRKAVSSIGPRAFPPSTAKAGPPGCAANVEICLPAARRLTSGWASSVAAHSTLQSTLLKNAKLTVPAFAARVVVSLWSAGGGCGPALSKRHIEAVRQSAGRAGRIAPVPWPAAVIVPAYPPAAQAVAPS